MKGTSKLTELVACGCSNHILLLDHAIFYIFWDPKEILRGSGGEGGGGAALGSTLINCTHFLFRIRDICLPNTLVKALQISLIDSKSSKSGYI